MLKIGLTGSIGMGKSTTSDMFKQQGVPIFDADAMVHTLYQKGYQGYEMVASICPDATKGDAVDRQILSAFVQENPHALTAIEKQLHPLIRNIEKEFFAQSLKNGAKYIIFDIPLLYEMKSNTDMDKVIVITTTPEIQRERVMQRAGMTDKKFKFLLSKQIPDVEKRTRADYIVDTSDGLDAAQLQVNEIIKILDQLSVK
ncbi:MAG: dephospho-CoA kinase [Alphaproteobacteria bacterium]|nr:dephospho-CoA kinase [Alphaproteobacteria bacterium]